VKLKIRVCTWLDITEVHNSDTPAIRKFRSNFGIPEIPVCWYSSV